jgi:hypothetical protein
VNYYKSNKGKYICQKHILNAHYIIKIIAKIFITPNFVPSSGEKKFVSRKINNQSLRLRDNKEIKLMTNGVEK